MEEKIILVLGILFGLSEILSLNIPSVKANGVFQLVFGILKYGKEKLTPPKAPNA